LYGQKVDTINWCRTRLETLIPETEAAQAAYRAGETAKVGGVFIEFARQSDAQAAFQTLSHHQALHMSPRYIGVNPNEVVWKSQSITWWHRVIRQILVIAFVTALIVFWAIPVGFVGIVSNVSYLTTVPWLTWLDKIPDTIMGVVGALLPSVALAILMSLVPVIMRRKFPPSQKHQNQLTGPSLRQASWRTIIGTCRAIYPKRILRLPSCSSFLGRHDCFIGLGDCSKDHR
jgi:calcium permeable stress-gated cation channel